MEPVMERYPHYFRDDFGLVESHLSKMPGRLLDHEELENSPAISMVAQVAENTIARTRRTHNVIEPIKFTLVDSSVPNARAICAGEVDCIAISLELVFSLVAATGRLFQAPVSLLYGNLSNSQSSREHLNDPDSRRCTGSYAIAMKQLLRPKNLWPSGKHVLSL